MRYCESRSHLFFLKKPKKTEKNRKKPFVCSCEMGADKATGFAVRKCGRRPVVSGLIDLVWQKQQNLTSLLLQDSRFFIFDLLYVRSCTGVLPNSIRDLQDGGVRYEFLTTESESKPEKINGPDRERLKRIIDKRALINENGIYHENGRQYRSGGAENMSLG